MYVIFVVYCLFYIVSVAVFTSYDNMFSAFLSLPCFWGGFPISLMTMLSLLVTSHSSVR